MEGTSAEIAAAVEEEISEALEAPGFYGVEEELVVEIGNHSAFEDREERILIQYF